MVTGVVSDAVPVKDGVVSFDGDCGWPRVTWGGPVSTVKRHRCAHPGGVAE